MRRTRVTVLAVAFGLGSLALSSLVFAHNQLPQKYHWADGSDSLSVLTYVDHINGSNWPVGAAANEWDTVGGGIDVDYRASTCSGAANCVGVSKTSDPNDPVIGNDNCHETGGYYLPFFSSNNTHYSDSSYIMLNDNCGNAQFGDRDRRALACEEEGHGVGLDHGGPREDTCMSSGHIDTLHHTPRAHDKQLAREDIYDHND